MLIGCGGLDLDGAVARGQVRWHRACGRTPTPDVVVWFRGKLKCGKIPHAYGCHSRMANQTTRIRVSRELQEQSDVDRVVVHELGHELGAEHVRPGRGILAPGYSESLSQITADDLMAVPGCSRRIPEPAR